jgi:hypothetical protein
MRGVPYPLNALFGRCGDLLRGHRQPGSLPPRDDDRPRSSVAVEFAEQGRAQGLQGKPPRFDQELDCVGAMVGQAQQAAQPLLLGMLSLERVLGIGQQSKQ